jgi:hypothetical protein
LERAVKLGHASASSSLADARDISRAQEAGLKPGWHGLSAGLIKQPAGPAA